MHRLDRVRHQNLLLLLLAAVVYPHPHDEAAHVEWRPVNLSVTDRLGLPSAAAPLGATAAPRSASLSQPAAAPDGAVAAVASASLSQPAAPAVASALASASATPLAAAGGTAAVTASSPRGMPHRGGLPCAR